MSVSYRRASKAQTPVGTRKGKLGLTALWRSWLELWPPPSPSLPTGANPRHVGGRDGAGSLPCCCSRPCCPRRSQPGCKCGEVPCVPRTALAWDWERAGKGRGLPPCFLLPLSSLPHSRAGCVWGGPTQGTCGAPCVGLECPALCTAFCL